METTAVTLELAISSKTGVKYLPEQKISSANIQMYKLLDEVVKGIEGYTIIPERRQAVAAFSTGYMGFRGSEVQILSPRL